MTKSTTANLGLWFVLIAMSFAIAGSAAAGSHSWRFSEFYSSPDNTIQFIEMYEISGSQTETAITTHWYATQSYNQSHTEMLGSDLPPITANQHFLVGSVSYAALPGVPAPDYVVPDGIIDPSGDFIQWWFYQSKSIPPDTMPTDGVNSLHVIDPADIGSDYMVGVNSPTNLVGETGSVVLNMVPSPGSSVGWAFLLILGLPAVGAMALSRRREESLGH